MNTKKDYWEEEEIDAEEKETYDIYDQEYLPETLDLDIINSTEEAFMQGYLSAWTTTDFADRSTRRVLAPPAH